MKIMYLIELILILKTERFRMFKLYFRLRTFYYLYGSKLINDLKIYKDLSAKIPLNTAVTIGIFDGVHLAHQHIIDRLSKVASEQNSESMLITMWPHPRYVLNKDAESLSLISTLEEKLFRLEKSGLDNVLVIPFDKKFAGLPFESFVKQILVDSLSVSHMVIGFNHQFGKNRQGDFAGLCLQADKYGFGLEQMAKVEFEGGGVSSSAIRNNIQNGGIEQANSMLGYSFSLKGSVVHGNAMGRKLGFPTANIEVNEIYKIIPADGVYAVKAELKDQILEGMLNIGTRPTVDSKGEKVIEVNFFDFDENIYEMDITIQFMMYIRKEIKFSSVDELVKQIKLDKLVIQKYFKNS